MDLECWFWWEARLCLAFAHQVVEELPGASCAFHTSRCERAYSFLLLCAPRDEHCQKSGWAGRQRSLPHLNLHKTKAAMPSHQKWQVLKFSSKFHSSCFFFPKSCCSWRTLDKFSLIISFWATVIEERTNKWILKTQSLEFKLTFHLLLFWYLLDVWLTFLGPYMVSST